MGERILIGALRRRPVLWVVLAVAVLATLAGPVMAAEAQAAAPGIPTFKQARDWQAIYATRWMGSDGKPDPELDEAPIGVSFQAPSFLAVRQSGRSGFVAAVEGSTVRVYFARERYGVWSREVDPAWFFAERNLVLGGLTAPIDWDWEEVQEALRNGGKGEEGTFTLLPDEKIAGRTCLVLRSEATVEMADGPEKWISTQWFDREYGVTLGARWKGEDRETEVKATSVKFNEGVNTRRLSVGFAKGAPVFCGAIAEWANVEAIGLYVGGEAKPEAIQPFLTTKLTVLQPTKLPRGFTGPYGTTRTVGDPPESDWTVSQLWLSKSGGVITLDQSVRELSGGDTPGLTAEAHPPTLRGEATKVLTYRKPFAGTIINWQEGDRYYRLEGTGVSQKELEEMVEGMREVTVEGRK